MNVDRNDKTLTIALLVYEEVIAETVFDHINAFLEYSRFNIKKININAWKKEYVDTIVNSDVVVLHYTVNLVYQYRLPLALSFLIRSLDKLKILFIQDEYRHINKTIDSINFLKIDVLFTCVPEQEIEKVYPSAKLPYLKQKINVLTGYVPSNLIPYFHTRPTYEDRSLDVVYRSRKLSNWYGRLGLEKWIISDRFKETALKYNLNMDLSYNEQDRIYGKNWIRFLQSSKAVLGVESGASVFDFTGNIEKNVTEHEKNSPQTSFEELEKLYFPDLDGKIYLNQISPRCFECAALGTLMILYEGYYSGVLEPWKHYIPLKKDHSNIEQVIESVKNKETWYKITNQVFMDIVESGKYSYKKMINTFDSVVMSQYKNKSHIFSNDKLKSYVANSMSIYTRNKKIYSIAKSLYKRMRYGYSRMLYVHNCIQYVYNCIKRILKTLIRKCYKIFRVIYNKILIFIYKKKYRPLELFYCDDMFMLSILRFDDDFKSLFGNSCFDIKKIKKMIYIVLKDNVNSNISLKESLLKIQNISSEFDVLRIDMPDVAYLPKNLSGLKAEYKIKKGRN